MEGRPRKRCSLPSIINVALVVATVSIAHRAAFAQPKVEAETAAPAAGTEAAEVDPKARAIALHDEARALYERGDYREAIERLHEATKLDPDGAELVYNLALIHEKLAEIDAAEDYYRKYLTMQIEPEDRARVEGILRRIEGAKKDLADRPQSRPVVTVIQTETKPKTRPDPSDRPDAARFDPWVIAFGGIAAGGVLVGTAFAISAVARDPGSEPMTGGGVTIDEIQNDATVAHTHAVLSDISFLLAASAAGAGLYVYFSGREEPAPAQAGDVDLAIGAASGAMRVRF